MFGLEISSVPVILPTLEHVLHGDFKGMQWIMNAYTLAVTTVLMATGTLADRYGRRRMFVIGIALFGITSLICGLAQTVPMLIAARLMQGASGGAMLICQVVVLSHQFSDGPERARAFSAWGIIFGIGLGFMLMKLGSGVAHAGVTAMLPGCVLAGAGLGLTNTPVTNTTTASVPTQRAGMASGIDMSARMITLAINIALMGTVLVGGILYHLKTSVPATLDMAELGRLAERIAAGDVEATRVEATRAAIPALARIDPSGSIVHAALMRSFGWVMVYGGAGVWVLAALSFVISGSASRRLNRKRTPPAAQRAARCDSC
nr:MFS transporter [Paraburkholderia ribeironis]